MFQRLIRTDNELNGLLLRLTIALVMFPHGAQKALGLFGGQGFSATLKFFTDNGMPTALVVLIIMGEFLGPISLAIGFLSRFCAASIAVIMIGAASLHIQNGFFMNWFSNQKGEGIEYHILMIGLCLAVVLKGSGWLSVDRLLMRSKSEA